VHEEQGGSVSTTQLLIRFGLAAVIGIFVGLQREVARQESKAEIFAGARTFALIALVGCTAALLAGLLGTPWAFLAIALVVGGLIAVSYAITAWRGDIGLTSEMAALAVFLTGALCYFGQLEVAAALGVGTAVLLSLKVGLRRLVGSLTEQDVVATLKFAVITAIVLPLLPNRTFGPPPLDVLNPQNVWLMVVFISAISFVGYLAIKLVGPRRGIGLTGLLGGLVSSTAVTLSFTQRSRGQPELARAFALAITVAWAMMFARVLIEAAVLNPQLLSSLWLPMVAAGVLGLAYCGYLVFATRQEAGDSDISFKAPFELGPALQFAVAYAVILVISRGAQMLFGDAGVYLSAALSGIADVDAITLSLARMTTAGTVEVGIASQAIVVAAMVNTAVKGGLVIALGSATLRRSMIPALALMLLGGLGLAFIV
jgi:uncharacterized membrane protein (DUF4010 family)